MEVWIWRMKLEWELRSPARRPRHPNESHSVSVTSPSRSKRPSSPLHPSVCFSPFPSRWEKAINFHLTSSAKAPVCVLFPHSLLSPISLFGFLFLPFSAGGPRTSSRPRDLFTPGSADDGLWEGEGESPLILHWTLAPFSSVQWYWKKIFLPYRWCFHS